MIQELVARSKRPRDEEGAALITVLMLLVFVFSVVLTMASASLLQVTLAADSRQDLEAFASAEAGRDAALTDLVNSRCTSTVTTTTAPVYTYRMYRYKATGSETPTSVTQSGVTAGCPLGDSTHALVQSIGTDGHTKTVVTTFKWNPATSSVLYGALVSGGTSNISGAGVILPAGATIPGDVVIGSGDLKCSNSIVQGSVYVLKGNLDLQGCNRVSGNASASGYMKFSNNNDRVVDGNACTRSYFDNWSSSKVGGTSRQYATAPDCAGLNLSGWNDYNPTLTGAVVISAANCGNITNLIKTYTTPTVLNATACSQVTISDDVAFKTDVSIVSNSFSVSNKTFTSFGGSTRRMFNMITPDKTLTTPATPHCGSGQSGSNFSQVQMDLPMSGLIYTPCDATFSGGSSNWTGQIQFGSTGNVNALLTFVPVSAPLDPIITFGNASPTIISQVEP